MKRILIVDDAIDLGRLLQDALKLTRPEIPITVVPSAEEALLEATRFQYDLLVTDLRLPGMTGLELMRKIRVRQPAIKVMVITALAPEDRLFKQTQDSQMDAFLRKPISIAAFIDSVDQLIGVEHHELPESSLPPEQAARLQEDTPLPGETAPVEAPAVEQETVVFEESLHLPGNVLPGYQTSAPEINVQETALPSRPEPAPPVRRRARQVSFDEKADAILDRLGVVLGAMAVLLVDGQGNAAALSGEMPDPVLVEKIVPAALTLTSQNAGADFSGALQVFRGTEMDIVLAPAAQYGLLVFLNRGRSTLRLAIAVEEVLTAQVELSALLAESTGESSPIAGANSPRTPPEIFGVTQHLRDEEIEADLERTVLELDPDLDKLQDLVSEEKLPETRSEDPDAFWEAAADTDGKSFEHPGSLSYDQAQKLGLIGSGEE